MQNQYTRLYRAWHWLLAFSTLGLLATVLLRKTFLSWRSNAEIIQTQLTQAGVEITPELAKATAKAIRSGMWEWHYIFGLLLGIAIIIRIYMMLSKQAQLPIIRCLQAPTFDKKLQYGVYTLLCFFIMIMGVSGGVLYYGESLGLGKESIHSLKEAHEFLMNGVIVFVVLHLIGVLKHELTTKEPVVSKMIHGD